MQMLISTDLLCNPNVKNNTIVLLFYKNTYIFLGLDPYYNLECTCRLQQPDDCKIWLLLFMTFISNELFLMNYFLSSFLRKTLQMVIEVHFTDVPHVQADFTQMSGLFHLLINLGL